MLAFLNGFPLQEDYWAICARAWINGRCCSYLEMTGASEEFPTMHLSLPNKSSTDSAVTQMQLRVHLKPTSLLLTLYLALALFLFTGKSRLYLLFITGYSNLYVLFLASWLASYWEFISLFFVGVNKNAVVSAVDVLWRSNWVFTCVLFISICLLLLLL